MALQQIRPLGRLYARTGRRAPTTAPAFTLLELLVVVAVVAILAGFAFPVFAGVRQAADQVICMANLRSIGQGIMTYVSRNDGYLLPGQQGVVVRNASRYQLVSSRSWTHILVQDGYVTAPTQQLSGFKPGYPGPAVVNPQVGSLPIAERSVFVCPATKFEPNPSALGFAMGQASSQQDPRLDYCSRHHDSKGILIDTSYGINGTQNEWQGLGSGFKYQPLNAVPILLEGYTKADFRQHRITDLRRPSETALVADSFSSGGWIEYSGYNIAARHNGRTAANVLLADGHVESVHHSNLPDGIFLFESNANPRWLLEFPGE